MDILGEKMFLWGNEQDGLATKLGSYREMGICVTECMSVQSSANFRIQS